MINRVHHIGIIVKDIEENISMYRNLNYTQISNIILDKKRNIKVVFLQSCDSAQVIELIESIDETSIIYNFKNGYHHICYEVDNNFIKEFKNKKLGKIFTKPDEAPAINNRKVVFGCLNNGAFVEFLFKGE